MHEFNGLIKSCLINKQMINSFFLFDHHDVHVDLIHDEQSHHQIPFRMCI